MNTDLLKAFLVMHGFTPVSSVDFLRENNGFLNAINLQVKTSGDVFFINMGAHPLFPDLTAAELPAKEIDCYIRTRLSTEQDFHLRWLNSPDDIPVVLQEITQKAWPFFDAFHSLDAVFSTLSVERIESDALPAMFNGVTKVRLVAMCMHYHLSRGNTEAGRDFADYGLSIAGKAVGFRKAFRQIVSRDYE